ncbi:MAG: hypothetical protein HY912_24445 [Desulfomonile tiedjei]|uniref:Low-complexity protein n=1 Tax=Desulfomonile tiedjei TaxID=2358 RepID=A0A9D6Z2W4_9BACT|nr:hypothetical protein [Desulfomonile tiedjei]
MKKKVLILVTVVSFLLSAGSLTMAQMKAAKTNEKESKVYCCHGKGDCDKIHTKAECEKEGGKVVKSCKECK